MKKIAMSMLVLLTALAMTQCGATISFGGAEWTVSSGTAFINGEGHLILEAPDSTGGTTSGQLRINPTPNWWRYPNPDTGSWYEVSFKYDADDMFHTRLLGTGIDAAYGIFYPSPHYLAVDETDKSVSPNVRTIYNQYDFGTLVDGTSYTLGVERTMTDEINYYVNGTLIHSELSASNISLLDLVTRKRWVDGESKGGAIEITEFKWGTGTIPEPATIALLSLGAAGLVRRTKR